MRVTLTIQRTYSGYEMARPIQEQPEGIECFSFGTIAEARQHATLHYEQTGWRRDAPGTYSFEASIVWPGATA